MNRASNNLGKNDEWNIHPQETWDEITSDTVRKPELKDRDNQGNRGWMKNRMCPNCLYTESVLWIYPPCKISISDENTLSVHYDQEIRDTSIVKCECCGNEGPFSEWEIIESPEKTVWAEGDEIACLRRRSGNGRMVINDLYKFTAKKGADNVLRWCITRVPLCKHLDDRRVAKHICRHLEIQLIVGSVKHRERVRTMGTMAENALTTF